jgi:hypothetical protein
MRKLIATVFNYSLDGLLADESTRLFDDVPKSYRLGLVSSTASSNGIVELEYCRLRLSPAAL